MAGIRVIAGRAKGVRLALVPGEGTRPISDRVKEALFNIIGAEVIESHWLDLFAGTGSVGIEALSRGAAWAWFNDSDRRAVRTVTENLARAKLSDKAKITRRDAFRLLQAPAEQGFDYVYVAPPQYQGLWSRALRLLDERVEWLNPDAWVVAQLHPREYEDLGLTRLEEVDQRRYGNTLLVFYEYPGE